MKSTTLCDRGGAGHKRLCRCGAMVYDFLGYNASASWCTENLDGTYHDCPSLWPPDTCECICGKPIVRYPDGRRYDLDGCTPHVCVKPERTPDRPEHLPLAPIAPRWHISRIKVERRTDGIV